jgi:hypothetical protein
MLQNNNSLASGMMYDTPICIIVVYLDPYLYSKYVDSATWEPHWSTILL